MKKRNAGIAVAAVLAIGAWYAFRPERAFIDKSVDETLTTAAGEAAMPVTLATGQFHSVHHDTKGTASVLRLADGKRVLRLTQFETSNGPDVRVYLVAAPDASDNATVTDAGFIELGPMKGNIGDQNYDVPEGVDLAKYRTVTIWCKRFSVNFGSAPLAGA
jgi:hypothetical protein